MPAVRRVTRNWAVRMYVSLPPAVPSPERLSARPFSLDCIAATGNCVSGCRNLPAYVRVYRSFSENRRNEGKRMRVIFTMKITKLRETTANGVKRGKMPRETYPHLRELALIRIERYENLIRELVSEILPQHVKILCLYVQQIVSGPLTLVYFVQRVHERLWGSLHRCKDKTHSFYPSYPSYLYISLRTYVL